MKFTGAFRKNSNMLPVEINELSILSQADYIGLTYVAAGNGAGEIETVTYKTGGASGVTLATLTLVYDSDNNLSTITRT